MKPLFLALLLGAVASVPAAAQQPVPPDLPIVLRWVPGVGDWGGITYTEQDTNEAYARHLYVKRVIDDGRELRIAWKVLPEGDYPAKPSLFEGGVYPSGTLVMPKGVLEGVIDVRTVVTGKPDWHRDFKLVLTDEASGRPILDPYMLPVVVEFRVTGDLKCAPGRPDLCDLEAEDDEDEEQPGAPAAEPKK